MKIYEVLKKYLLRSDMLLGPSQSLAMVYKIMKQMFIPIFIIQVLIVKEHYPSLENDKSCYDAMIKVIHCWQTTHQTIKLKRLWFSNFTELVSFISAFIHVIVMKKRTPILIWYSGWERVSTHSLNCTRVKSLPT